jgi:hypothetical protein
VKIFLILKWWLRQIKTGFKLYLKYGHFNSCSNCSHADYGVCGWVFGRNFGHTTEISTDFWCRNWNKIN